MGVSIIRNPRDFFAGLIFLFFGVLAAYLARGYPLGSTVRMGPGYFPFILCVLLALLGAAICARSLVLRGHGVEGVDPRALILVLAAVGAFAATIEPAGIIVAAALLLVIGTAASRESKALEVIALTLVLLALIVAVFVYGLGLPFKLWPG
jgi:Tripartite tricarboxylate transporter TctB family